jgi:hypothetical protein
MHFSLLMLNMQLSPSDNTQSNYGAFLQAKVKAEL